MAQSAGAAECIDCILSEEVIQSAGAVEYTNCISSEGVRPPPNECPVYDTKQSDGEVLVILELWECGVLLHCHRSQFHSGPK